MLDVKEKVWPLPPSATETVTLNAPLVYVPLATGSTRSSCVPGATSAHDGLPPTKIGSPVVAATANGLTASSTLSTSMLAANPAITVFLRLYIMLPPETALNDDKKQ
jgi:hypothetical protein